MNLEYENDTLALTWEYKIIKSQHKLTRNNKESQSTQYVITINQNLLKMANIRQAIFLYKNPLTNKFQISAVEPPIDSDADYTLIKTHKNKIQTSIVLPKNILKIKPDQKIVLKYYPMMQDYYNPETCPKIEIDFKDEEESDESTAHIIQDENEETFVEWNYDPKTPLPEDMTQFLTADEQQDLKARKQTTKVILNLQTLKVEIQ